MELCWAPPVRAGGSALHSVQIGISSVQYMLRLVYSSES